MIAVYANTDKGLKRSGNEDAYLFNLDLGLFIVADGMGGHEGGEIASSLAVRIAQETVQEMLYRPHMRPLEVVQRAFERANDEIFEKATRSGSQLQGMGTTMVLGLHWKKSSTSVTWGIAERICIDPLTYGKLPMITP